MATVNGQVDTDSQNGGGRTTYTVKDYRTETEIIWCPGCGNYGVLGALHDALVELQIPPHELAIVSGIGCSSRLPGYVRAYGFNSVHGRALPIASGLKLVRPELTVLAVGGDGDGLSIGIGHFPHICRRNIDITYIFMDNRIYGLTKGQASPTSPHGDTKGTTDPYAHIESPLNPVELALAFKASFVARGFAGNKKHLTYVLEQAISHKGFSFVHVLTPCVTFRGTDEFKWIRSRAYYLPENYSASSRSAAFAVVAEKGHLPMGVIYREPRETFGGQLSMVCEKAKASVGGAVPPVEQLANVFLP